MGDRVLIQVVSTSTKEISPVVYCHWKGSKVEEICQKLKERMHDRGNDVQYAAARLVQIACDDDTGNTGFGIWNQPTVLTKEDSHGGAGCWLIHADRGYMFEQVKGS